jgi:hypothetical protein
VICARSRESREATAKALADATGRRIIPIVADTTRSEGERRRRFDPRDVPVGPNERDEES